MHISRGADTLPDTMVSETGRTGRIGVGDALDPLIWINTNARQNRP
jgi:hypothetical protein